MSDCDNTNPAAHRRDDPRFRIRLWINRALADEVWIDYSNPDARTHSAAARDRHLAMAELAELDNHSWLVETYDPAAPPGRTYFRFGTDPAGMAPHGKVPDNRPPQENR